MDGPILAVIPILIDAACHPINKKIHQSRRLAQPIRSSIASAVSIGVTAV
jgi:hypothetical protein